LNGLSEDEATAALRRCCGSGKWARAMAGERPFGTPEQVRAAADRVWRGLAPADWREAFRSHPRIGDRGISGKEAQEQAGAHAASADLLEALAAANRAYEDRFGHIFIVCASGKSAGRMLEELEGRLGNDPETEIGVAAEEQRKITQLRLDKLLE
jgi:OHCU decarboxylase